MIKLEDGQNLKFRKNFNKGEVEIKINGFLHKGFSEYVSCASYARDRFGLSGLELLALYKDYKADYEKRSE